jgi:CMP-N,N'-diacetyllegionaminic acid synthase
MKNDAQRKTRICLIAARGGSKRLPGKNIIPLAGLPLIVHSVEQAKNSGVCDMVAVSSDDQKILDSVNGADLKILRPPELATDSASSLDVIIHALETIEKKYNTLIFLQATSPLRLPEDIKKAVEIFDSIKTSSLVSVVKNKDLNPFSKNLGKDKYDINGSIYIWNVKKFLADPKIIYPNTAFMEMPRLRSVDIDYKSDFDLAALILKSGEYKDGESQLVDQVSL